MSHVHLHTTTIYIIMTVVFSSQGCWAVLLFCVCAALLLSAQLETLPGNFNAQKFQSLFLVVCVMCIQDQTVDGFFSSSSGVERLWFSHSAAELNCFRNVSEGCRLRETPKHCWAKNLHHHWRIWQHLFNEQWKLQVTTPGYMSYRP